MLTVPVSDSTKKIMALIDEKINQAKMELLTKDWYNPHYFYYDGRTLEYVEYEPDDSTKSLEDIKWLAGKPGIEAIMVIFLAETKGVKNIKEARELPDDFHDIPGLENAITIYLYTPKETYTRFVYYNKTAMEGLNFQDIGWDYSTTKISGNYANPFKK